MIKSIRQLFSKPDTLPKEFKKSFSQDGEDMILRSMFDDMGGRDRGFYIDIGALHPFRFSNTAYYYEIGWNGINIEPTPTAIELFNQYRERDINLNIGIGEKNEELTFYCFDEPALNSFSRELSEDRNRNTGYNIIKTIPVKVYPLDEVLDKYLPQNQKIDFLSIDVEGLDMAVLRSNNWEKYRPEIILAEDIIEITNLSVSEVYTFLTGQGYSLKAKTERTLIFSSTN